MKLNFEGIAFQSDNHGDFSEIERILGFHLEYDSSCSLAEALQKPVESDYCYVYTSVSGTFIILNKIDKPKGLYQRPYLMIPIEWVRARAKVNEGLNTFEADFLDGLDYSNCFELIDNNGTERIINPDYFYLDEIELDVEKEDSLIIIKKVINYVLGENIWENDNIIFKKFRLSNCFRFFLKNEQ